MEDDSWDVIEGVDAADPCTVRACLGDGRGVVAVDRDELDKLELEEDVEAGTAAYSLLGLLHETILSRRIKTRSPFLLRREHSARSHFCLACSFGVRSGVINILRDELFP